MSIDDPTTLIPDLLAAIGKQADGNLTGDDVTLLLFRPNGLGRRRPSLRQQVIATGKMIGAIAGSMRSGGEAVPWPDFKLPESRRRSCRAAQSAVVCAKEPQDDHG